MIKLKQDAFTLAVRFICGFLLGSVAGFFSAGTFPVLTLEPLIIITIISGIVCGYLAVRFGDPFWHSLKHWL